MNSQLYTAASGLVAEERRLELIANNLANASTAGYRPLHAFSAVYQRFGEGAPETMRTANAGTTIGGTFELAVPGPIESTGRPLDVALGPDDVLAIESPSGRRYTRAGSLQVNAAGELVDGAGRRVLGAGDKPITGLGAGARIGGDGKVYDGAGGDEERGRLAVFADRKRLLTRDGLNLLSAGGRDAELESVAEPKLIPQSLEASAVQAVQELTRLIEAQRAFESYQKLVSVTMNDVNRRAVNDIAG